MKAIAVSLERQLIANFNLFNRVMPDTCAEFVEAHMSSSAFIKAANPINMNMLPHVKSFYWEHVLSFGLRAGSYRAGHFKQMLHRSNTRFENSPQAKNDMRALRLSELSGMEMLPLTTPLTYLDASFIEWSHEALSRIVRNMKAIDASMNILDALTEVFESPKAANYFMFDFALVNLLVAGLDGKSNKGVAVLDLFGVRRSAPGYVHEAAYADFIESQVGKFIARDYDAKKTTHLDIPAKAVDRNKAFTRSPKGTSKKPNNHFVKTDEDRKLNFYTRQERRLTKGFDMNTIGRCPTPLKKVHVTVEKALEFIAEHHAGDSKIKPYTCGCGALHLGHRG